MIYHSEKTLWLSLVRVYLLVLSSSFISGAAAVMSYRAAMIILFAGVVISYIALDRAAARSGEAAARLTDRFIISHGKIISRSDIAYAVRIRSPLQRMFGCCSLFVVTCTRKFIIADISLEDSRILRRIIEFEK
ncbi:MAG: hypothetical protein IIZ59_02655 [Clostridia bacterium]|nr:hypothetical protein [Clostridia bacterium]